MRAQPKRWLNVRPLLLALLTTILLGSAHTAEAQTASEQTVETRKSPWVAFALSFVVIPGAGQAYNGQWGKGGLMLGGQVASAVVMVAGADDCIFGSGTDCGVAYVGAAGVIGFWLWSVIDAPITASAINRRIDAGQVALEIGPQLILPRSRSAMGGLRPFGLRSLNRGSGIDLSLVRVRF